MLLSFYHDVLQECCPVRTSQEHGSRLAFFDQRKGLVTSPKNNLTTYTANKEKD